MSAEEEEIYRRLMRERASKGGRNAWKGKNKRERSRIMKERRRKQIERLISTPTAEPDNP